MANFSKFVKNVASRLNLNTWVVATVIVGLALLSLFALLKWWTNWLDWQMGWKWEVAALAGLIITAWLGLRSIKRKLGSPKQVSTPATRANYNNLRAEDTIEIPIQNSTMRQANNTVGSSDFSSYNNSHCSQLKMPEPYHHIRHWKYFVKQSIGFFLLSFFALACIVFLIFVLFSASDSLSSYVLLAIFFLLAVTLLSLVMVYREYWKWRNHPIVCSPKDGYLKIYETRNQWLAIRGSSPDTYLLDNMKPDTPKQTWLETFFFTTSQTLVLKSSNDEQALALKDVVFVDKLLDIQSYRQELYTQQTNLSFEQVELLRQIAANNQRTMRPDDLS